MNSTPASVIAAVGVAEFAQRISASVGKVRVWKHRNKFPRQAWPEISNAFPELTTDTLLAMERKAAA